MMQFFGIRASMSGDPARLATLGEDIEWIGQRVFIPSSLLAFVTGILLVVESDFYGFGDDWIVIGLALYATTFLAGLLFIGPESGRIGKLSEARSPEVGARTMRLVMLSRLDLVLLFALIYDMTVKPDVRDAGSMLIGIALAAGAAGIIYGRSRTSLEATPRARPTSD